MRPGMYLGPDRPHETNHGEECRKKYSGLSTCSELQGVNLNPHEQNHSKTNKHLSMLCNMGYDRFSFTTTLINELENEEISRTGCDEAVGRETGYKHGNLRPCRTAAWLCGRWFCSTPLMRSFDKEGRLRLTLFPQES